MGGKSTQETSTTQQTTPGGPSAGLLSGILGKIGNVSADMTGTESSALGGLLNNAGFLSQFLLRGH